MIEEEEYISYDLAILLKELGYNKKCTQEYDVNKKRIKSNYSFATNDNLDITCLCTTISYGSLDKFLREKYNIYIFIIPIIYPSGQISCFSGNLLYKKEKNNIITNHYKTTRESIFAIALNKLIKEKYEIQRN